MAEVRDIKGFEGFSITEDKEVYFGERKIATTTFKNYDDVMYVSIFDNNGTRVTRKVDILFGATFPEHIAGRCIPGYSGYKVTDTGDVYSFITGKNLKTSPGKNGYKCLSLVGDDGKKRMLTVHRLVALTFIPVISEKTHVNHKDGNKLNNSVDNLEWVNNQENRDHAWETGLMSSKLKKCTLSTDNKEFIEFNSLTDAKIYIANETGKPIINVGKLSQCAKKNCSDKTNRGVSNKDNPFRYRGYIVKYLEQIEEIK